LAIDYRIPVFLVPLEEIGGRAAAEVAVNAASVDVVWAGDVFSQTFGFVSHSCIIPQVGFSVKFISIIV
jgi:hypothetical protein